jgi:hypothetical protein
MNKLRYYFAISTLLITGCSALPMPEKGNIFLQSNESSSELANVYIFRNSSMLGSGGPTQILFDNKEVARIDDEGYTKLLATEGCYVVNHLYPTQIENSMDITQSEFCFKKNEVYYLRVLPNKGSYSVTATNQPGAIFETGRFASIILSNTKEQAFNDYPISNCHFYSPLVESVSKDKLLTLPEGAGEKVKCGMCFETPKI